MSTFHARPTIPSDIEALGIEVPYRIRAMTAIVDGEIAGIGGVMFLPNGTPAAFMQASDAVRTHKMALHRGAVRFFRELSRSLRRPIAAFPDEEIEAAPRWLERLGFTPSDDNEAIWIWRQ
jgi:hypothetical protein